jgi:hypothetical protein
MIEETTTRCTTCYSEFTDEQLVEHKCCPNCKTTSLPMAISQDVTLKINWHELRILTIWAANWAEGLPNESRNTFNAIIKRLEAQAPEKAAPLTLFGEIQELRAAGHRVDYISNGKINKDPKGVA